MLSERFLQKFAAKYLICAICQIAALPLIGVETKCISLIFCGSDLDLPQKAGYHRAIDCRGKVPWKGVRSSYTSPHKRKLPQTIFAKPCCDSRKSFGNSSTTEKPCVARCSRIWTVDLSTNLIKNCVTISDNATPRMLANSKAIKTNCKKVMHRLIHKATIKWHLSKKASKTQFLMKITWLLVCNGQVQATQFLMK